MSGRTVELTVAGETYRVITTASEQELAELAAMVEEKLEGLWQPGRPLTTRAMMLAAVSLAHDVTEQRTRADAIARRAKEALGRLLGRVDSALQESESVVQQGDGRRRGRARSSDAPPAGPPSSNAAAFRARDGDHASDDG
jgi:cell division protein ZapA